MDIRLLLEQIFNTLNRHDNHILIMAVYLALALLAAVLRIITHLHFNAALLAFQMEARKDIKEKKDITLIKNNLLRKIVAEYKRIAERAVTTIPTKQIVNRTISTMSLLGWKYDNIIPLIKSLENGLLLVGLILAVVFPQDAFTYGTVAVGVFLLTRLLSAFFNAQGVKNHLTDEIILYVEREIGRFFQADSGSAVLRLKDDLTSAIALQTKNYTAVTEKVIESMSETLSKMSTNITTSHDSLNESAARLAASTTKISTAAELLATHMQGHSNALSNQLITLVTAIDSTKEAMENLSTHQQAIIQQSEYIESNQKTLETALESYESSLQNLTKSLGESLGAFINLHAQSSANAVNEALKTNLEKILKLSTQGGKTP